MYSCIFQLLAAAFIPNCVDTWGVGTVEANTLCSADYSKMDPSIPTGQGDNFFGEFTAAQVRGFVGDSAKSNSKVQPGSSSQANIAYQIPDPVEYDPTLGISGYNHLLDDYISAVSSHSEETSTR